MKIALLSDSHDNVSNLEKAIDWLNDHGIKILIHAGDLSAPSLIVKVLAPNFRGVSHLVLGNVGDPTLMPKVAAQFKNISYHGKKGHIEVGGKKIAFTHLPQDAETLAKESKYDLVVYGHTHTFETRKENGTTIVNPGSVGGLFSEATFAIYDTETAKVETKSVGDL